MELIDKANVIQELDTEYEGIMPTGMQEIFDFHDLGAFYSYGLAFGHILSLSDEGESKVDELWVALTEKYNLDTNDDYTLESFILSAGLISDTFMLRYNIID